MSEWILPAACQAVVPAGIACARASLPSPAVKNEISRSSSNAPLMIRSRPDSVTPRSSRIAPASASSSSASSDSIRALTASAAPRAASSEGASSAASSATFAT